MPIDILTHVLVSAWVFMTLAFLIAAWQKNNGLVDIAWGLVFILISFTVWRDTPQPSARLILVIILIVIWGLRLAYHLGSRNLNRPEDFRYATWRKNWKRFFLLRSYLVIYMLQGALAIIICSPVILLSWLPSSVSIGVFDLVGVAIWLIGFIFEAVGDWQLAKFKSNPGNRGKLITTGVWKYTRHPNYFGEVTMWWGIFVVVFASTLSPWALISPLLITYMILFVSGIPMLEAKYAGNPEFQAYKAKTSAFFPLPPQRTL